MDDVNHLTYTCQIRRGGYTTHIGNNETETNWLIL